MSDHQDRDEQRRRFAEAHDAAFKGQPRVPAGHGSPPHGGSSGEWTSGGGGSGSTAHPLHGGAGSGGERRPPGKDNPGRAVPPEEASHAAAVNAQGKDHKLSDKELAQLRDSLIVPLGANASQLAEIKATSDSNIAELIRQATGFLEANRQVDAAMTRDLNDYARSLLNNAIDRFHNANLPPGASKVEESKVNLPEWLKHPILDGDRELLDGVISNYMAPEGKRPYSKDVGGRRDGPAISRENMREAAGRLTLQETATKALWQLEEERARRTIALHEAMKAKARAGGPLSW